MYSAILHIAIGLQLMRVVSGSPSDYFQKPDTHARRLGFNQTWVAPTLPCNASNSSELVRSFVASEWDIPNNSFYGYSDFSFVNDTITNRTAPNGHTNSTSCNDTVVRVFYGKGSLSPSATRQNDSGVHGGTEFYAAPYGNTSYAKALLRYDVTFDNDTEWVLGGKLPGIFSGRPGPGCSGGNLATGENCFSIRLMWRSQGEGEVYAYIPTNDEICDQQGVQCNSEYGTSLGRGAITFPKGQWTKMEIYTSINDPPSEPNGELLVWQDGKLVINVTGIQYRTRNTIAISSIMFSTFFGGSTSEYATPVDTYSYFRNIQYSVATPVALEAKASVTHQPAVVLLWFTTIVCLLFATAT